MRSNRFFIVGCSVTIAIVFGVAFFASTQQQDTSNDGTTDTTSSTSTVSADEPTDTAEATAAPASFEVPVELMSNTAKVLEVYFVSPTKRQLTPKSVLPFVTSAFGDELEHKWDGDTGDGSVRFITPPKFEDASIVDGVKQITENVKVETTYFDGSKDSTVWTAVMLLTPDFKIDSINVFPGEGG